MKGLIKICLLSICIIGFIRAQAQTELTFYTTKGNIKVQLTDALTPITVDSFIVRVKQKFYDGVIFHRVISGFVVQGGDPTGTGSGVPPYHTPDEIDTPTLKNVQGSIAMANNGPGTGTDGCQFYFNLVNNNFLDGKYTVFGMTTSGFSVVQTIGHVPTNSSDKPITNVYMDSVRVTKRLAIPTINNNIAVNIYPNPGKGLFNIELPTLTQLQILNATGQPVYSTSNIGKATIDLRDQPAGVYIVRITNESGTALGKLVLQ